MTKSYFSRGFLARLSHHGTIVNFLFNAISSDTEFYQQIGSTETIDSYMIILFIELLRAVHESKNFELPGLNKDSLLLEILDYIENNYQTCTLISTADHFGYNQNYLGGLLKKKTGKTFKELKLIQQMTYASFLLLNSTKTVHEIADEVGFSNHGFFFSKFKAYFSVTPKIYRDLNGKV